MDGIEVTFSRRIPASWPPLHAARIGADCTLCSIAITDDWDYDADCGPDDVECERCRAIISK